jgi:hypothetical protein
MGAGTVSRGTAFPKKDVLTLLTLFPSVQISFAYFCESRSARLQRLKWAERDASLTDQSVPYHLTPASHCTRDTPRDSTARAIAR